jgi:hypothetical protein
MGDGKDRRSYQAGNKFRRSFTWVEIGRFKRGVLVLWKDGGKWYKGRVANTVRVDDTGAQYITVENVDVSTHNVETGETTRAYPDGIKRR